MSRRPVMGALWCRVVIVCLGLLAGVAFGEGVPPAPTGTFSVVAFPDTQAYSARQPAVFHAETQWVVDHLRAQRIVFVCHLGDIVDENIPKQWTVAKQAMARLDKKVPYGLVVGNHDMKTATGDASLFSSTFPAKRFAGCAWYRGQIKDNANSYQTFEAEGLKFVVLHLECNAPDDVLAWADSVLKRYADRRAIVATHMFLGPLERPKTKEGWYTDPKGVMRWHKCHGQAGNSPAQLWAKCFSKHKNVFLILCGDQSRTQAMHLALKGEDGHTVHACLSDYREGYLRVYRFIPKANQIRVMTYSPTKNALCEATSIVKDVSKHQFTLHYDMTPPRRAARLRGQRAQTTRVALAALPASRTGHPGWVDCRNRGPDNNQAPTPSPSITTAPTGRHDPVGLVGPVEPPSVFGSAALADVIVTVNR